MSVYKIKKKALTISIPMTTHRSLCLLAKKRGLTSSQYVRSLLMNHIEENGLPLYFENQKDND